MTDLNPILKEFRAALKAVYGDRLGPNHSNYRSAEVSALRRRRPTSPNNPLPSSHAAPGTGTAETCPGLTAKA
jgi:hypothetical protein